MKVKNGIYVICAEPTIIKNYFKNISGISIRRNVTNTIIVVMWKTNFDFFLILKYLHLVELIEIRHNIDCAIYEIHH